MFLKESAAIILAFLASIGWGLSATLFKRTTRYMGPLHFGNLSAKKMIRLLRRPPFIAAVILKTVCGGLYLAALSVARVSVVGPLIAVVYPTQALSARYITGERISKMDAISIIGVFIGVGLIASLGVGML